MKTMSADKTIEIEYLGGTHTIAIIGRREICQTFYYSHKTICGQPYIAYA